MRRRVSIIGVKGFLMFFMLLAFTTSHAYAKNCTLAWDPNPDPDAIGYKLFYRANGPINGTGLYDGVIDVGNVTEYTVSDLKAGTVYFFAAKTYDIAGNESAFSEDVSVEIQNSSVPGDANADGRVDAVDLATIMQAFNSNNADANWNANADLDASGTIDAADLNLALANYGVLPDASGGVSHTITASAGTGGAIFPENTAVVADGGSRTFLIVPENGYTIAEVLVDGMPDSVTDQYAYDFSNVTGDHTIEARFAPTAALADNQLLRLDFSGNFQDASGWQHHGVSYRDNLPTFTEDRYGRSNKACQFDGVNDFIRVANSADFSASEYTLSAWIYGMRDFGGSVPQYIASKNLKYTDNTLGMFILKDNVYSSGRGWPHSGSVLGGMEYCWNHLTVVRRIKTVDFYLNGKYIVTMPTGVSIVNTLDLVIGAQNKGASIPTYGFFNGAIDDLRFFNRPLSDEEIQDMAAFPGDVNGDNIVDETDLSLLSSAYGASEGDANWNPSADLDHNGQVDAADADKVAWGFGVSFE